MTHLIPRRRDFNAHEDHGFFGPDSITWKVWGYPTSLTVAFQRSVVVEELDPALVAAVDASHEIYRHPRLRYDRTIRYFAQVAFGGARDTAYAADLLVKVHAKAVGAQPYTGQPFDANDPDSQLWIHLTGWHSNLYAYEKYGPGRLSEADELRYWQECAVAAEFQTCRAEDLPRNRAEVQAYFERMRPQLVASPIAVQAMNHLLDAGSALMPATALPLRPFAWAASRFLRAATLATIPRWMREMAGLRQTRLTDALIVPLARTAFFLLNLSPRMQLLVLKQLSPSTVPVVAPIKLGIPPVEAVVRTPAEARELYGLPRPADAHLEFRERQRAKAAAS